MKREEMIKRYEDIVLNIHGKAGDEERADYILALCRITQLICQLYQPEQDTKWQKLKEWFREKIKEYEPTYNEWMAHNLDFYSKTKTQSIYKIVLDKMQELEAEDEQI